MAEAGGPAAQAGIHYQNSVAALHMGRMVDARARSVRERVVAVRVEAPGHVDDIVVRYADGTSRLIQAKLTIRQGDDAWAKLWSNLSKQLPTIADGDRLAIVLADSGPLATNLRECCSRTTGGNADEWLIRLTKEQRSLVESVGADLGRGRREMFDLFKHLEVEIVTEPVLARDMPPLWMPAVPSPETMHSLLRDLAGGGARHRDMFEATRVREHLREQHGIELPEPDAWGSQRYRKALAAGLEIAVPGTSIVRPIADGFIWPTATRTSADRKPDFDDETGGWRLGVEPDGVDLSEYPSGDLRRLVVVAGPGFGKSTLVLALAARALAADGLPVRVTAPELSGSDLEISEHLQTKVNESYGVAIDWRHAAETGLVVLLLDGLDEVGAERRSVILDRLKRFSALFPAVDWVLTVRDIAALPTPAEAQTLELSPLGDDAVRRFIAAYCPDDSGLRQRLHTLFDSHPEMRRLSRIPLFLAMLLATVGRTGRLPRDRTDVIEDYLALLWDPGRFKPTDAMATDPAVMRDIAERAAFDALERDEIGVTQRLLERMARSASPAGDSRTAIQDLVKCGVLRRPEPSRYEFPFPIVQEYLAGCHLLDARPDEIPKRLEALAKRPWAQAIQFALERHPDPSEIVDDLLATPDDAFNTQLRLLGRCVANGMPVCPAQRQAIVERLVALWNPDSFWTARAIGNLLADGFVRPLAPELRERLFDRDLLHYGSGRILTELADGALTIEVLRQMLSEGVASLLHLSDLQTEVDRIGGDAFRLYLKAVRAWAHERGQVTGICALIEHLDDAHVDQRDVVAAAEDQSVPVLVRAAALSLLRPGRDVAGVATILRDTLRETSFNAAGLAAAAALRTGQGPAALVALAQDADGKAGPDFIGQVMLDVPRARRSDLIDGILGEPALRGAVRDHALVFATSFGHTRAFAQLLARFGEMEVEIVAATCALLGHFPTIDAARNMGAALSGRTWDANERRRISSSLSTGLTGKLEMSSFSSGSMKTTGLHPGRAILLPMLVDWSSRGDYEACDALRMGIDLVRLGYDAAMPEIRSLLDAAMAAPMTEGRDIHFQDHVIGNAIDLLQERRDPLAIAQLEAIARDRTHNARSSALRSIARQGTSQACDSLMGLYAELTDASSRDSLLTALQSLAAQLGVKVTTVGDELAITSI